MIAKLSGFKLSYLAFDPFVDEAVFNHYGVRPVALETLLGESDTVSLHIPLKDDTFHLINAERLAMMKEGACLINTSRGGVIDEAALLEILHRNRLGGGGLDVLENIPDNGKTPPVYEFNNVIVTPHNAGPTLESIPKRAANAFKNIQRVMDGEAPLWAAKFGK
mgnify:CR=1 FL=1